MVRHGYRVGLPDAAASWQEVLNTDGPDYGGSGVTLGWETGEKDWDAAIARALADPAGWVAQERIAVRRETFPVCADGRVEMRDMLVDFAPYIFRGRLAGFLTRLSATGLANVTSGGGESSQSCSAARP